MRAIINVSLPQDLVPSIDLAVKTGPYKTRSEFVRALIQTHLKTTATSSPNLQTLPLTITINFVTLVRNLSTFLLILSRWICQKFVYVSALIFSTIINQTIFLLRLIDFLFSRLFKFLILLSTLTDRLIYHFSLFTFRSSAALRRRLIGLSRPTSIPNTRL